MSKLVSRRFVIFVGVNVFAMLSAFVLLNATALLGQAQTMVLPTSCPKDWASSSNPEVVRTCSATRVLEAKTEDASIEATQQARSSMQSARSQSVQEVLTAGTPVPLGYIPDQARQVKALNTIEFADGPPNLRGSTSIWQVGAFISQNQRDYNTLYLLAHKPVDGMSAFISTELDGIAVRRQDYDQYHKQWLAPQDVGTITITNVTALAIAPANIVGTVTFTTTTGKSGMLDLASGTWSIN